MRVSCLEQRHRATSSNLTGLMDDLQVDRVRDAPVVSKPVKGFLQVSGIVRTSGAR
jgi:hypothetical protein